MIPAFSTGRLFDVARKASDRDDPDSSLVATLFSVIAAEAWLNDLLYRIRTARPEECIGNVARVQPMIRAARLEDRNTSAITKCDVIGATLSEAAWTRGIQPFQDFDLLLDVRNFIVHQKPELTPIDVYADDAGRFAFMQPKLTDIAERLVSRGVVSRPAPNVITPGLAIVQQHEVGRWAYATSHQFIEAMIQLLPAGGWRRLAVLGMEDIFTPPGSG